ncbi:MAG TPA: site-specific integrase [Lacipirellulaceae bacterium]|nr:site-specific integrase [Lacipirellulaceae bacterium]
MSNAALLRRPKYRRHKAKGLAVVTLDGRDYYLGEYGSPASREKYRRLVATWELAGGKAPVPHGETTVAEVLAAYLRFARGYYVKNGRPTNEVPMLKRAMGVVRGLYSRERATAFGPLALKAVRQQMIELGWCRNQVNKQTDRVKRIFKWAASEEMIPGSVYESLRTVAGLRKGRTTARESDPVRPVADDVVEATIAELSPVVRDMVLLQRYTGARPGEICDLRPGDVNRAGPVWEYIPQSHKVEHHERPRVVFIGPKGQAVLLPYLLRPADAHCFSPAEAVAHMRAARHEARTTPASCGNVVGSNRQRRPKRAPREKYDVHSYGRAIRRAAVAAGVAPWSPHRLRHAFATEVRKSHGLEAVQVALGHSQAQVSEIYAARDFALAARVAAEVG